MTPRERHLRLMLVAVFVLLPIAMVALPSLTVHSLDDPIVLVAFASIALGAVVLLVLWLARPASHHDDLDGQW